MSTVPSSEAVALARFVEARIKSAVYLGGPPGPNHSKTGYHSSVQDNPSGDYSVQQSRDKTGDKTACRAVDIGLSAADMRTVSQRLLNAKNDPRMKPIREFFGCLDPSHNGPIIGWDWSYGGTTTSSDLSHRGHIHLSIHTDSVHDGDALLDVAAVICGIAATTTPPKPPKPLPPAKPASILYPLPSDAAFSMTKNNGRLGGTIKDRQKLRQSIRLIQRKLHAAGYDKAIGKNLKPSGYVGPLTVKVWKQFQKTNGLTPNSKFGDASWAKMFPITKE